MCSSSCYACRSSSRTKTGTRLIIRLDELSSVVRPERRTTEDSSSRLIIRIVPVFVLDEQRRRRIRQAAHVRPRSCQTDSASRSIKRPLSPFLELVKLDADSEKSLYQPGLQLED